MQALEIQTAPEPAEGEVIEALASVSGAATAKGLRHVPAMVRVDRGSSMGAAGFVVWMLGIFASAVGVMALVSSQL